MLDWAIGAVPFVFLGARLLHALWERPDYPSSGRRVLSPREASSTAAG